MNPDDLNWAAEEACGNAWPSPRQLIFGSWVLRAAGGPTRRANAVSPLRPGPFDPSPVVDACERIYAARGQPSIFRVPSIAAGMDARLSRLGYAAEDDVCTLLADLTESPGAAHDPDVTLDTEPSEAWYAARSQFANAGEVTGRVYRDIVGCMLLPKRCATLTVDGTAASIAIGLVDREFLVLEAVATAPARRSRGYGRRTVAALMQWAKTTGAKRACLQVVATNGPARALYAGLGFKRELYRYHYRRKDLAGRSPQGSPV